MLIGCGTFCGLSSHRTFNNREVWWTSHVKSGRYDSMIHFSHVRHFLSRFFFSFHMWSLYAWYIYFNVTFRWFIHSFFRDFFGYMIFFTRFIYFYPILHTILTLLYKLYLFSCDFVLWFIYHAWYLYVSFSHDV